MERLDLLGLKVILVCQDLRDQQDLQVNKDLKEALVYKEEQVLLDRQVQLVLQVNQDHQAHLGPEEMLE